MSYANPINRYLDPGRERTWPYEVFLRNDWEPRWSYEAFLDTLLDKNLRKMVKDPERVTKEELVAMIKSLGLVENLETPTEGEIRNISHIAGYFHFSGKICGHPANCFFKNAASTPTVRRSRLVIWKELVVNSSAPWVCQNDLIHNAHGLGPETDPDQRLGHLSSAEISVAFPKFKEFPTDIRDLIIDLLPVPTPRVIDLHELISRSYMGILVVSPATQVTDDGDEALEVMKKFRETPGSSYWTLEESTPGIASSTSDVLRAPLGLVQPEDILLFNHGYQDSRNNRGMEWSSYGDILEEACESGLGMHKVAVSWGSWLVPRSLSTGTRGGSGDDHRFMRAWSFLGRMRGLKTLYVLTAPGITIRVPMARQYFGYPIGWPNNGPLIQAVVDLYDDRRLAELLSLNRKSPGPNSPRWSVQNHGVGPCINCQRAHWEEEYEMMAQQLWVVLHNGAVPGENRRDFLSYPWVQRVLKRGPRIRPAILFNLVPYRLNDYSV